MILVSGATGFVGSHICKDLILNGYKVIGMTLRNNQINLKNLEINKDMIIEKGDINNKSFVESIFSNNKISSVIHCAAQLPSDENLENLEDSLNTNMNSTINLLKFSKIHNVKNFIYISSIDVYSEPPDYLPVDEAHPTIPASIYGVGKYSGELVSNLYSREFPITIFRPSVIYGIGQKEDRAIFNFVNQCFLERSLTIEGDGKQQMDFINIKDLVNACLLALKNNTKGIYNIGSGESISIIDLCRLIKKLTGSSSNIKFISSESNKPFKFSLDIKNFKNNFNYNPLSISEGIGLYIKELNRKRE